MRRCDIDLSILGRAPDEYAAYAHAIRDEYAWVPFPKYAEARIRVLETFLARPSVFVLDELQQRFGEQAVSNMREEIRSLANPPPDKSPDTL
jgi:predicted metal-dependent HD superfamily phosphohydrolase